MKNRRIGFGLTLVVVGLILMAHSTGAVDLDAEETFSLLIPVLLMIAGLWLIARRRRAEQAASTEGEPEPYRGPTESTRPAPEPMVQEARQHADPAAQDVPRVSEQPSSTNAGRLKYSKLLGDIYVDLNGTNVQNVEVSNFIGDIEIRLHGALLAPGLNRLVISGFIGDVRILHSPDMPVFAQCSNFIGDIELMGKRASGFGNNLDAQTANYGSAEAKLYIASNLFIGDIRMYSV